MVVVVVPPTLCVVVLEVECPPTILLMELPMVVGPLVMLLTLVVVPPIMRDGEGATLLVMDMTSGLGLPMPDMPPPMPERESPCLPWALLAIARKRACWAFGSLPKCSIFALRLMSNHSAGMPQEEASSTSKPSASASFSNCWLPSVDSAFFSVFSFMYSESPKGKASSSNSKSSASSALNQLNPSAALAFFSWEAIFSSVFSRALKRREPVGLRLLRFA